MEKSHPGHRSILNITLKRLRNFPADSGEARRNLSYMWLIRSRRKSGVGAVSWGGLALV